MSSNGGKNKPYHERFTSIRERKNKKFTTRVLICAIPEHIGAGVNCYEKSEVGGTPNRKGKNARAWGTSARVREVVGGRYLEFFKRRTVRKSYGSGDVGGTFKRLRDVGILSWKAGAVRGIGGEWRNYRGMRDLGKKKPRTLTRRVGDNGGGPRGPRGLQKMNKKVGGGAAHRVRREIMTQARSWRGAGIMNGKRHSGAARACREMMGQETRGSGHSKYGGENRQRLCGAPRVGR
ncbi:hypothetical protein C8J57DRAFT_1250817 [Mycena rebaudengoi]|nr:hypothetical protein C8J57DRAFT_1250817 [Mycena rebaudengoi]